MSDRKIDIAIVGGGVSGVYSAWKLKNKYPDKVIEVFEGGDHIGGRLLSVVPPCIPEMVAELGGMRIMNNQFRINQLITEINASIQKELPGLNPIVNYPFPVDQPQNIAYLRGVHLRLSDFTTHPDKVPYQLSFLEHGNTSGTIITNAIEQIVPGITSEPDEEKRMQMAHHAEFGGVPLREQGFWNVLYRVISGEAYQFCLDSGGYNTTLLNWNAADAIPWFLSDFGTSTKYFGFKGGFQQVPIYLGQLFEKAGGKIHLNAELASFTHSDGGFNLVIEYKKLVDGKIVRTPELIDAEQLILAMPRRSLDLLAPKCPLLREGDLPKLIGSVTPRPLFKLFTTYMNPWWRITGYTKTDPITGASVFVPVDSGRTVTDLPVRQTYYWPLNYGSPPSPSSRSMLLASYDDGNNIGFWDGLRRKRSEYWSEGVRHKMPNAFMDKDVCPPYEGNTGLNQTWSEYEAPEPMVTELSRQLRQVHSLDFTPEVRSAAYRDWGEDPFGGGWNSWNIGVNSTIVRDTIVNPIADCRLFICGEAYSDGQGWVEGALQTADIMLEKGFKIKQPERPEL